MEWNSGCNEAFARSIETPGLSRANTFTHLPRRFSRLYISQPGVISFFIITGMRILGE